MYKKLPQLTFLLLSVSALLILFTYYKFLDFDLKSIFGLINPVSNFLLIFIGFILVFLFLPSIYFKNWLLYTTTWYLPLTYYIAANTKPLGGSILSPSRSEAVIYMMLLLGVVTIIFLGVQRLLFRRENQA